MLVVALVLTLARWRPAAAQTVTGGTDGRGAQASDAGPPRSLTRNGHRAELLEALVGLEAAMV